ncbi:MAG: hypothetical protein U0174_25445 [Polyangiaceae bacterium]
MRLLPTHLMNGFFILGFATVAACSSTSTDTATSATTSQSAALENTQCAQKTRGEDVAACRATYDSCRAADGADIQTCRDALLECLPKPGEDRGHGHGGPGGGGGRDCDGGPPPPPPGDAGPPPQGEGPKGQGGPGGQGAGVSGDGPQGGGGPGGGGGGRGGPPRGPRPDRAAMEACHTTFTSCINASEDVTPCFDAERTCVKAAFDAAFQARCAEDKTKCDNGDIPAEECTKITTRCAQGSDPGPNAKPAPDCSANGPQ